MNYEQLINAKVTLIKFDATVGMYVGGAMFCIAIFALIWSTLKEKQDGETTSSVFCFVVGGVLCIISPIVGLSSAYKHYTAEMNARSDLANYGLVEIIKNEK